MGEVNLLTFYFLDPSILAFGDTAAYVGLWSTYYSGGKYTNPIDSNPSIGKFPSGCLLLNNAVYCSGSHGHVFIVIIPSLWNLFLCLRRYCALFHVSK